MPGTSQFLIQKAWDKVYVGVGVGVVVRTGTVAYVSQDSE